MSITLAEFAVQFREDVLAAREIEGEESFTEISFVRHFLELLAEAGEIDDAEVVHHKAHGMKVNGYVVDVDTECLDLFVAIHSNEAPPPSIDKAQVEQALKQLLTFLQRAQAGLHERLEESATAFDAAFAIHEAFSGEASISKIRLFLLTDGVVRVRNVDGIVAGSRSQTNRFDGIEVSYHIWDMERLFRWYTSGHAREEIVVDLISLVGEALPCIRMPAVQSADYETYLCFVPGALLVEIYGKYGARLLERNVRSFLQAKGAINKGLKKTLGEEPQRFLAYNNGLTATASHVGVVSIDGGIGISQIKDLQIVNGGQTTASIFHAAKKDSADVGKVLVQLKLNLVKDAAHLDDIVARISQYANSQNRVNVADFSANDPFHRRIEELSRTVWAPPPEGSQRQTHWFYERARGQYADDRTRQGARAAMRQFELINPRSQMFTKTDLAKFENTWMQRPHWVSKGAQKNFAAFTVELGKKGTYQPDERYFEWLIAKGILFRRAEQLVQQQQFGGYRANIVTYTLALISHATAQRLDLAPIWKLQSLPKAMEKLIVDLSRGVRRVITSPPNGRNVTEWCKAEDCWLKVKELPAILPASLQLVGVQHGAGQSTQDLGAPDSAEQVLIDRAAAVLADVWFGLSAWAKETSNLAPWQRSLAYSLGRLASSGKKPSFKQAKQGLVALDNAEELGFKHAPAEPR